MNIPSFAILVVELRDANHATCSGRKGGCLGERRKHWRDGEMFEGPKAGGFGEVLWVQWTREGMVVWKKRKYRGAAW